MENQTNSNNEATRALFNSSAQWMRSYAIIMIILASILALATLILSAGGKGLVMEALEKGRGTEEVADIMAEIFGVILLGMACLVILLGYSSIKLLGAANRFTALSYTSTSENIVTAFKNLRMYWMFVSISMIMAVIFGIYFFAKAFSILSQMAQS